MHLFEALLALSEVSRSPTIAAETGALAEAVFGHPFDACRGCLPELYDAWKPLASDQGGYTDLRGQFEWSLLLSQAVPQGFPPRYLRTGERLLDCGLHVAYDPEKGGIWSRACDQDRPLKGAKSWWEQAEFLRSVMPWAALRGRRDLWPACHHTVDFIRRCLVDPEYGGWSGTCQSGVAPEGARDRKGTVWMTGYHVAALYSEALQLSGN